MKEKLDFFVDVELVKKFKIALMLSNDNADELLEKWISNYNMSVFSKEAGIVNKSEPVIEENVSWLVNKVRKWANNASVPHKIIKSYLLCCDPETKVAEREMMRFLFCKNENEPPKKFNDNLAQMMSKGKNAHGKVFDLYCDRICVVEEVRDEIFKLKEKFLK